jgi:hypothetical protein
VTLTSIATVGGALGKGSSSNVLLEAFRHNVKRMNAILEAIILRESFPMPPTPREFKETSPALGDLVEDYPRHRQRALSGERFPLLAPGAEHATRHASELLGARRPGRSKNPPKASASATPAGRRSTTSVSRRPVFSGRGKRLRHLEHLAQIE